MPRKFGKENNSNPGTSQLGHPPFSNVKLEGPKKHHDFHGNDASVPARDDKRIPHGEHWEKTYDATGASATMNRNGGADFNPKRGQDRATTHIKVNREDH